MTSQEPAEIGRSRGEVTEPRRANEILKAASAFFAARARQTPLGAAAERRSLAVCGFLDSLPGMKPSRR